MFNPNHTSLLQHISQLQLATVDCPREQCFQFNGARFFLITIDSLTPAGQNYRFLTQSITSMAAVGSFLASETSQVE